MKPKKRTFQLYDHSAPPPVIAEVLSLDSRGRPRAKITTITPSSTPVVSTFSHPTEESSFFQEEDAAAPPGPEPGLEGVDVVPARRYKNSDFPLATWRGVASDYLDELMRLEGRGDRARGLAGGAEGGVRCACGVGSPVFRCRECHGRELVCQTCLKQRHRRLPLHLVEEWDGTRFQAVQLGGLGLRVQVGHESSPFCPAQVPGVKDFVVLHTNGIHKVHVDFCGCPGSAEHHRQLLRASWWPSTPLVPQTCATMEVLRQFHALNLQGKISAYDFYKALEIQSDGAGVLRLPDRLPMFTLMVREWRFAKMLKRGKRGLDPSGIEGTKEGELAVRCPACPIPGVNLPSNWMNAPPETVFLYWLVLAMDANFRLKSRLRSSEERDPSLGDGLSYFVESHRYGQFVVEHTSDEEISSCVAFAALATANLKKTTGLAATGVGAVTCGRHQFWRPNGIGDLQKGERYVNMDYIFLSTLVHAIVKILVSSYDLGCQWKKTFWRRLEKFPDALQLSLPHANVKFLVPEFHLQAHKESCHSLHSSRKTPGMGRSELEGPERNWAWLNGAATSTKEMGPGSRRDTLDDFCGFANWRRVVGMGDFLLKKMLDAIPNAILHHRAFREFDEGMRDKRLKQVEEWEAMFAAWEADRGRKPSPFATPRAKKSLAQVKQDLKKEEQAALGPATEYEGDASALAFLLLGLEIEQQQRGLVQDLQAAKSPTTMQLSDFEDRRRALRCKLRKFRRQQHAHMPGLPPPDGADPTEDAEAVMAPRPELALLSMPSDIVSADARQAACAVGVADMESRLRLAEAEDSLDDLRRHLRVRTFVNAFKVKNIRGQRPNTRARHTQTRIDDRVRTSKLRYQCAYGALMRLTGGGDWTKALEVLKEEDVRSLSEDLLDVGLRREEEGGEDGVAAPMATQGRGQRSQTKRREGTRKVSWIWFKVRDMGDENDPDLHEALRVEWAKSKVRAARWHEEVMRVEEEMRRVLETFAAEAGEWEDFSARRDAALEGDEALKEGVHAYAAEHAALYRSLAEKFGQRWAAVRSKATPVLDGSAYADGIEANEGEPVAPVVRIEVEVVARGEQE